MSEAETVACRVTYTGRVQGVGFRDTACDLAGGFAVGGWVRNLPDGRVLLYAEGEPGELVRFLAAIRGRWRDELTDEAKEMTEPTREVGFRVER